MKWEIHSFPVTTVSFTKTRLASTLKKRVASARRYEFPNLWTLLRSMDADSALLASQIQCGRDQLKYEQLGPSKLKYNNEYSKMKMSWKKLESLTTTDRAENFEMNFSKFSFLRSQVFRETSARSPNNVVFIFQFWQMLIQKRMWCHELEYNWISAKSFFSILFTFQEGKTEF